MKKINILSLIVAMTFIFAGCSSSDEEAPASSSASTPYVSIGQTDYYAPEGVRSAPLNDSSVALEAEDGEVVGLAYQDDNHSVQSAPALRRVEAANNQALTVIRDLERRASNSSLVTSVNRYTEQSFSTPFDYVIGDYLITTNSEITPSALMSELSGRLVNISDYPNYDGTGSTSFRLSMAVAVIRNHYYYLFSLVSESNYAQYGELSSSIVRPTNLTVSGAEVTEYVDNFTGTSGSQSADFLFVVDDSGSMSSEQNAIRQAANDFGQAIAAANLANYNIAIISTGRNIEDATCTSISSCASALVNQYGAFTNIQDFKDHVVLGTSGSATETGIYNAEQTLLPGGTLSNRGFPSTGHLSVIIISDEPSQYNSRSQTPFNLDNNVFTQNGYQVYSIIESSSSGDYENLSARTGGFSASITNTNPTTGQLDYSEIMRKVAQGASGATSQFVLTHTAGDNYVVAISSVKVNGQSIVRSTTNGWSYNAVNNSIVFYGSSLPQGGDSIEVRYSYANLNGTIDPEPPVEGDTGSFTGAVFDPTTHQPVVGATVTAQSTFGSHTEQTDASGNYTFTGLAVGGYSVSVVFNGYTTVLGEITITATTLENYGQIQILPSSENSNYTFTGHLIDAVSGGAIASASIAIHEGYQSPNGPLVTNLTTDTQGNYSTTLGSGYYTFVISQPGYITRNVTVLVWSGSTTQDITLSPQLTQGEVRITLTWGATPSDLDSHLAVMNGTTREDHIFYGHPTSTNGMISLDRDDTSSYGPETITLSQQDSSKVYKYYVHDFSDYAGSSTGLSQSSAVVTVDTASQTYTFNVPNALGTGWKVFEIQNGNVVPCVGTSCVFDATGDTDTNFGALSAPYGDDIRSLFTHTK